MAKYKNKVQAALAARRAEFDKIVGNETNLKSNGLYHHKPGSQNRNKGYGKRGGRR